MNPLLKLRSQIESGVLSKQAYIEAAHSHHHDLFNYPLFIAESDVEWIKIQPNGVYVRSRSQGIEMLMEPSDQHLVPCTLMNFRQYEENETHFLKRIARNGWTAIDIGANCGWYSLALAKAYPDMVVHACEPIAKTHAILQTNVEHNQLHNIQTHQIGFSNREGQLQFLYTPTCSGATSLIHAGQPVQDISALQSIDCPCTTLDKFCDSHDLAPQLIKCDVEGAELQVIQGGQRILQAYKPVVLVELLRKWSAKFGYHPNDVFKLLAGFGYQGYTIKPNGLVHCTHVDDATVETNFVFLHNVHHTEIISHA
ncbi:MAG TPA: FkbM family methyltransferase [Burkholderiaceae bacterium]|nr:FkbM family methyltransferase [Burkholderiaceae bacterium]